MWRKFTTSFIDLADAAAGRRDLVLAAMRRHPVSANRSAFGSEAMHLVRAEMARARRHERPFSILGIPWSDGCDLSSAPSLLREIDQVVREERRIVAVLPETDEHGARLCVDRLAERLGIEPRTIRWATFPTHALTVGGLYRSLDASATFATAPARNEHDHQGAATA